MAGYAHEKKRGNGHRLDDQTRQRKKTRCEPPRATYSDEIEQWLFALNPNERNERLRYWSSHKSKIRPTRLGNAVEEQQLKAATVFHPSHPLNDGAALASSVFPSEIWRMIIAYLERPLGDKWPYELLDNLEDPYLDSEEEWLVARRALCSLRLTSRFHYELATEPLYRSVCLGSGKSMVSLLYTLVHRPNLAGLVHELIIIGPIKEYECCKAFAAQKWVRALERISDVFPATHAAFAGSKSWSKRFLAREPEGLVPTVASAAMVELFLATPELRYLAIAVSFMPYLDSFDKILSGMRGKGKEEHVFPKLSSLVILGRKSREPALLMKDWPRLFRRHSNVSIENLHLVRVHLGPILTVPSTVKTLQLSHATAENLALHGIENLEELDICIDGSNRKNFREVDFRLCHLPHTLRRLRLDSGYSAYVERRIYKHSIPIILDLPMLTQLTHLQVPMALLFENPDVMGKMEKAVTDIFPSSLSSLVLQEVWPWDVDVRDYSGYGDKMASFLKHVAQDLPGMQLEFREQWYHAISNQRMEPPMSGVGFKVTKLFPETSSALCKRAAALMQERCSDALELAREAVALDPQNRKARICLAQTLTGLGWPRDALKILTSMDPPASDEIKKPAQEMLDHLNKAGLQLRTYEDAKGALEALNLAIGGLADRNEMPREWLIIKAEANLSMS